MLHDRKDELHKNTDKSLIKIQKILVPILLDIIEY